MINFEKWTNKFGKIYSFADFGNVNYWYEKDKYYSGKNLPKNSKLIVDINKLGKFLNLFSEQKRFYYGLDPQRKASIHIIKKARNNFITITKPIQWIKHYFQNGKSIRIPKCNFDVEISVDSIRLLEKYNSFCLLSGDSDFARLARFLKSQGKKFILIGSGHISHWLKNQADLFVNAQQIKKDLSSIKNLNPA